MKTYLHMSNLKETELPPQFRNDDVRYPEAFVAHFLEQFTKPGDIVFDPFAGYGTTMVVAESLGRVPFGIEFDQERAEFIRSRLKHPDHLIQGDSRQLSQYPLLPFDFSLTSPPYMNKDDPEDPFTAYSQPGRGYVHYLETIQHIYTQMWDLMKPNARVIIEAANIKGENGITTLAWDVAKAIGQVLTFKGEIVIAWDEPYSYGYNHSYCLMFSKD